MCHESALVERPNCSSTRNHSDVGPALPAVLDGVQPAAQAPVERLVADHARSARRAGARRARSASTSSGISTSSTKARARACSSACAGVEASDASGGDLGGHGCRRVRVDAISGEVGSQGTRAASSTPPSGCIAREGIDDVRIARIAIEAGVSAGAASTTTSPRATPCSRRRSSTPTSAPATLRMAALRPGAPTAAQRLAAMIDQCLPPTGALHDDFVLWVELWLRAPRDPELRPIAARLYARLHAWFAQAIADGRRERRAARLRRRARWPTALLALIDGYGIRVLDRRSARCRSSARAPRSGRRSRATSACRRKRALIAAALRARPASAPAERRPRRWRPPSPRR